MRNALVPPSLFLLSVIVFLLSIFVPFIFHLSVDILFTIIFLHFLSSHFSYFSSSSSLGSLFFVFHLFLTPSVQYRVSIFIQVTIERFYIGIKTIPTLAINLLTAIHPS